MVRYPAGLLLLLAAGCATVAADLTAVIALQGLPCGQVVAAEEQAETDYAVSCADGNLYPVYLNAAGPVVVKKRN